MWNDIDFYKEDRYHPTQKPIKLIERLIIASSNKGDIVLDPFMGAGSTLIASKNLDRKCLGFEIDAQFCEVANNRANGVASLTLKARKAKKVEEKIPTIFDNVPSV